MKDQKTWLVLFVLGALLSFAARVPAPVRPPAPPAVEYDVRQHVIMENRGLGTATHLLLRVALIRDLEPYQEVLATETDPPSHRTIVDENGNVYATFEFGETPPGQERTVEVRYRVVVRQEEFGLGTCEGPLDTSFVHPERWIESDSERIINLADELTADKATVCEKARAIYDYVVHDAGSYGGYERWDKGAWSALEESGGDCTEFADLQIALSRAAGIPARFVAGVTCCTQGAYSRAKAKHNWLELSLPGAGWVPMDPTWAKGAEHPDVYFAGITQKHIIVTRGRNLPALGGGQYVYVHSWWHGKAPHMEIEDRWLIDRVEEGEINRYGR
jgi:hypothetical protein